MRRFTVVLAILEGLFMFSDGLHALITGAYFAPGGQIGPWAPLVSAAGISPFSTGVKIAFVALGAAFMLSACAYALFMRHSAVYLSATAVMTLWYLPLGTLLSLIVLASMAAAKPALRQPPQGGAR